MKIISRIRNIIPTAVGYASLVSRALGRWYCNGAMYGKNVVALAFGYIFRRSGSGITPAQYLYLLVGSLPLRANSLGMPCCEICFMRSIGLDLSNSIITL
ncbi:MAG: hypothetical protein ACP5UH_02290 [Candidatus Micrarchaeia archaeon]